MYKRNYKITPSKYGFKVEMWNDFGMKRTIYENNVMDASEMIMNWWESSKEEFEKRNIHTKCMVKMFNK